MVVFREVNGKRGEILRFFIEGRRVRLGVKFIKRDIFFRVLLKVLFL